MLLNNEEPKVSGVVAASLWGVRDGCKISDEFFGDWKEALVRHVDEEQEYVLESVFPKFPDIAYEWIAWRLEGIRTDTRALYFRSRYDRALPAAIRALTREQRRKLLDEAPRISAVAELVRSLVGRDLELFLHLLSRQELERLRLAPLRLDFGSGLQGENVVRDFDEGWQKMAVAALDKGFSEDEIFSTTQGGSYGCRVHCPRCMPPRQVR